LATPLVPEIGSEAAARIAKKAYQEGKTVEEVVSAQGLFSEKRFKEIQDLWRMTQPGF